MSDLAKNNNGSGTNGGANAANETTGLSASELYRRGRALAFGLDGVKIDGPKGLALLEAAAEAGSAQQRAVCRFQSILTVTLYLQ